MCAICSRAFRNNWDLNRHSKIHTRLLLQGGKKERVKHERAVHTTADIDGDLLVEEQYAQGSEQGQAAAQTYCNLCSKDFKTSWSLQRHVVIHSTANRPYKCESCSSAFKSKSALTTHTQRTHSTETKDAALPPVDPHPELQPLIICPRCAVFSCHSLADLEVHHETCELEAVASELVSVLRYLSMANAGRLCCARRKACLDPNEWAD